MNGRERLRDAMPWIIFYDSITMAAVAVVGLILSWRGF